MSKPIYLQIFSITDHTQALNQRYQGPYKGINAELQTSQMQDGSLKLASSSQGPQGPLDTKAFDKAQVVLAYRHSDTGELQGSSESLLPLQSLPWTDMPGLELKELKSDGELGLKLWIQDVTLKPGQLTRVHFGKTMVYLKNFGPAEKLEWTDETLTEGPTTLHAQDIHFDVTIAPPSGSALMVKQGQDTEH